MVKYNPHTFKVKGLSSTIAAGTVIEKMVIASLAATSDTGREKNILAY